jgi:hypothetical protein
MKFKNRLQAHQKEVSSISIHQIAKETFGDLAECFVVVGYSKGGVQKFAVRISDNEIHDEALEWLRPIISEWFTLFNDKNTNEDAG